MRENPDWGYPYDSGNPDVLPGGDDAVFKAIADAYKALTEVRFSWRNNGKGEKWCFFQGKCNLQMDDDFRGIPKIGKPRDSTIW